MTMTFSIAGIHEEDGDELPCPGCGLSLRDNRAKPGASPMNCACSGYGGPEEMPVPQFELNVANVNGYAILEALGLPVDYCGEADPRDILAALVTAEVPTVEPTDERHPVISAEGVREGVRVISGGRSIEQVARYVAQLRKIATKAAKYDRRVVWS